MEEGSGCDPLKSGTKVEIFVSGVNVKGAPLMDWTKIAPPREAEGQFSSTIRFKITNEIPEGNKELLRKLGLIK